MMNYEGKSKRILIGPLDKPKDLFLSTSLKNRPLESESHSNQRHSINFRICATALVSLLEISVELNRDFLVNSRGFQIYRKIHEWRQLGRGNLSPIKAVRKTRVLPQTFVSRLYLQSYLL